jgi:hypothetical protein
MFSKIFKTLRGGEKKTEQSNFSEQETAEKSEYSNIEGDLKLMKEGENLEDIEDVVDSNSIKLNAENEIRGGKSEILDITNFNQLEFFNQFLNEKLSKWRVSSHKDEHRPSYANKSGGIDLLNKEVTTLIRSVGYEIIKQIGRKIISGDFNLTTVSFPIKVMLHLTILQTIAKSVFQFPVYLNLAASQSDPLERFKYVITSTISCFHNSSHFLKPVRMLL